jgi:peptidase E/GNAT superfamily N-acetyltransferase
VTGQVILASSDPRPFDDRVRGGAAVVFVPTAANHLPDRGAIVEPVRRMLDRCGARWNELDLADAAPEAVTASVAAADAVLVGGGDPYRLLQAARRASFGAATHELVRRGGLYCGISAGAMLAAPSLEPLRHFSPFTPPADLADLGGLNLADLLVLPHTDREGRRAEHEATLVACGRSHHLVPLNDGEAVIVEAGRWFLDVRPGLVLRAATPTDAPAIAELFVEAGRVGWAGFLTPGQLDQIVPEPAKWADRIDDAADVDVTVAVDDDGIAGFIWVRPAEDDDLTEPLGEVATFYTHPRVWGTGVGRRVMAHGLDRLRAMGYHECVLWTEERNERPRRIYAESGWILDGTTRTRDFHGFPITELRHRYRL